VKYLLKIKRKRIEKINQEPIVNSDFLDFDKMSCLIRFLFDSSNSIDGYEIYESYSYFDDSEFEKAIMNEKKIESHGLIMGQLDGEEFFKELKGEQNDN
jgi:hypothetical protein